MTERKKSLEQALEEAVSRALRDNLAPLQRTAEELQQAYADLVAACSSSRPSNALPAMLRAQTAASSLAAGLNVLSNFVAVALNPRERPGLPTVDEAEESVEADASQEVLPEAAAAESAEIPTDPRPSEVLASDPLNTEATVLELVAEEAAIADLTNSSETAAAEAVAMAEAPAFDIASLPSDERDLHRRANRVAKVAMQDIKLLRPADVRLACEHKDICERLRNDLDKARREYDRRFRAILDHPVDYFHHWMVEILADGNSDALGDYPYPSPVLRH